MGLFNRLFSSEKVTARDLKKALLGLERDRRRKQLEQKKLDKRRSEVVERIRVARKERDSLSVDASWEGLKHLKLETTVLSREARIVNLEAIGVKRYLWGLERLQRSNNREGARKLIERARASGLDDKLMAQNIKDEEYLEELQSIMEDVGIEAEEAGRSESDPEKEAFLAEIDGINRSSEEIGQEEAQGQQDELVRRLSREAEGGAEA